MKTWVNSIVLFICLALLTYGFVLYEKNDFWAIGCFFGASIIGMIMMILNSKKIN